MNRKKITGVSLVLATILLAGCGQKSYPPPPQPPPAVPQEEQQLDDLIESSLNAGSLLEPIESPGLPLPSYVHEGQIKKYFKLDDVIFGLVLRGSSNLDIPNSTDAAGVLIAQKDDEEWQQFFEIKDPELSDENNPSSSNNPYYLFSKDRELLLTVVDSNGAGSGEGMMKVFTFDDGKDWKLKECYYFGGDQGDESAQEGYDYFALSADLSRQKPQPMEMCKGVTVTLQKNESVQAETGTTTPLVATLPLQAAPKIYPKKSFQKIGASGSCVESELIDDSTGQAVVVPEEIRETFRCQSGARTISPNNRFLLYDVANEKSGYLDLKLYNFETKQTKLLMSFNKDLEGLGCQWTDDNLHSACVAINQQGYPGRTKIFVLTVSDAGELVEKKAFPQTPETTADYECGGACVPGEVEFIGKNSLRYKGYAPDDSPDKFYTITF